MKACVILYEEIKVQKNGCYFLLSECFCLYYLLNCDDLSVNMILSNNFQFIGGIYKLILGMTKVKILNRIAQWEMKIVRFL